MRLIMNLKLKYQLILLISISLLTIALLQSIDYARFQKLTRERAVKYVDTLMEQVTLNVNTIASSAERDALNISYSKYTQEILVSDNTLRNVELHNFINEIFRNTMSSNANIYSIIVTNDKGRRISDTVHYKSEVLSGLGKNYNFQDSTFNKAVFTSIVKDSNESFYYYAYISPIFSTSDTSGNYKKVGTCVFLMDTNELGKQVHSATLSENSLFMILDQENRVIVSNKELKAGDEYKEVFWDEGVNGEIHKEIRYHGKDSVVQYKKIESTGWKMISVVPIEELTQDMKPIRALGIWMGIIMAMLLLFIGSVFIYSVTHPVALIVKFLSEVGERNLKQRLEIPSKNELGFIAADINAMLDKVEKTTRKIVETQTSLYETELVKKQAELSALQSQINPHFLYNTLNCLANIGLAYHVPEVVSISSAMSKIFRYSIKGEDIVSIKDEISCIKEYLLIMDIRYRGKFETEIDLQEDILELKTAKMILQPLVENAIYHGLEQKSGKGRLQIRGFLVEGHCIQFEVEDDGIGIESERLKLLREDLKEVETKSFLGDSHRQNIGLVNICKRVRYQFGSLYGMDIQSEVNAGTKVIITLPVIKK